MEDLPAIVAPTASVPASLGWKIERAGELARVYDMFVSRLRIAANPCDLLERLPYSIPAKAPNTRQQLISGLAGQHPIAHVV